MKKLLLQISVFATTISFAQTATNSPGSATNTMCAFAYSSTVGYSPLANVLASDNVYAFVTHCDCCDQNTQCLTVSDFGFAIPFGAVIDGIILDIERKRFPGGTSGIVEDNGLQIMKGGVLTGPDKAVHGVDWPLIDTYASYGTPTDLWGTTWTPADINASDFGASFASISYVCGATVGTVIDHMRMTVFYTTATGVAEKAEGSGRILSYPNPVVSGNSITFSNITKIEQIILTDILGKEIFKGSSDKNTVVLPKMNSGVYFYSIVNDGTNYTGKITVE